ncbi:MAG: M20/M25/M40 family metallo-hydrolase [Acidobacteriota bacterium]|nr:M20/M25/M40 family metallo-hydrolase [Acidobacteriota bacterium]
MRLLRALISTGFCATLCAQPVTEKYRDTAARLIGAALESDAGMNRLEYLCDRIGNRLSGSSSLEKAIDWASAEMTRAGLENVRKLPVKVPHWVRGQESATLLNPLERPLFMLGLGDSVGTPAGGITADVVAVSDFEELAALGKDKVAGKIVVFNAPYVSYGQTVAYRAAGPSRAAALGAVAVLVRSITPFSLRSPHTGALQYDPNVNKIPAAAVSIEDAESLARLVKSGASVRVRLNMEAKMLPDADSFDVIGEIPGSEKPEEIVVLGGHIDSWDIGQGAQDDGSGIMAALEAVSLIKKAGLRPSRTIRVAFWTNEENGGAGGRAYAKWAGDPAQTHVAAIEMDGGAEKPVGFGFGSGGGGRRSRRPMVPGDVETPPTTEAAFARAVEIGKLLDGIEAGSMQRGGGGSDIGPLMAAGVPGFGMATVGTHYFDWHHTNADTFDKVNPHDFKLNVAALAVLSYVLADMPERLSGMK